MCFVTSNRASIDPRVKGANKVGDKAKGPNEKVHIFDSRGYTVPLLRGYGRFRAHCDRAVAWW